jgi:hypothetical protein
MLRRLLPTAAASRGPLPSFSSSSSMQQQQQQRGGVLALLQRRLLSGDAPSAESAEREERMRALLQEKLKPTHLVIQDISGALIRMRSQGVLLCGLGS